MSTKKCKMCDNEIEQKRTYCSNKCKFSDRDYNKTRFKKRRNNKTLISKITPSWSTTDYYNLSGIVKRHLTSNGVEFNKDTYLQYFEVVDTQKKETFKCPVCEWTTVDINNKSGWIGSHFKTAHNMNYIDVITTFPTLKYLWKIKAIQLNREIEFDTNKDSYVTCQICFERCKRLTSNGHLKKHNLTVSQYKKIYPAHSVVSINSSTKAAEITRKIMETTDCVKWISNQEKEVVDFISKIYTGDILTNTQKAIPGCNVDIFLPEKNLIIEYNGLYWHSELNGKDKNYHVRKTNLAEQHGIRMIQIFEDEWTMKQNIVKSRLANVLGVTQNKIHARKCVIKEIDTKTKNEFLNENHLQNTDNSNVRLGLYYNNILVSVMTFRKPNIALGQRQKSKTEWELSRFSTKLNTIVIGGAKKLFSYFVRHYNPKNVYSYSDRRWSKNPNETVYAFLGFTFCGNTLPGYWYTKKSGQRREHRFNYTKSKIISKMGGNPNKTEWHNMIELGYDRIWDCGHQRHVITFHTT